MFTTIVLSILSPLFFVLAAICNALMDTLQFHWYKFRFKNSVNAQFWNPEISWKNKYIDGKQSRGLKYKGWLGWMSNFSDAWHLFKMIMIFFLSFSVLLFPYSFKICFFENNLINLGLWLVIFGVCWNFPFNLFYNKIFVIKK